MSATAILIAYLFFGSGLGILTLFFGGKRGNELEVDDLLGVVLGSLFLWPFLAAYMLGDHINERAARKNKSANDTHGGHSH